MPTSPEPKYAKLIYRDRWTVSYLIDGPGKKPNVQLDPNTPDALERERILKLIVEHETHPHILESARRGLKTLEEQQRKLVSNETES